MTTETAILLAHELACLLLFFSVFCRMNKTTRATHTSVRLSFWVLGTVALLGVPWPMLGWPMELFGVALALAIVLVQWVTSHYWQGAAPRQFTRGPMV